MKKQANATHSVSQSILVKGENILLRLVKEVFGINTPT